MSEEQQVSNEPGGNEDTKIAETPNANVSELIAESKKYRQRSQASETRVAELEAKINSFETDQLKEKEEFKTLYEKVSAENEQNKATAEKWVNYEATERESLLKQVPEDEKADWQDSPLNLLSKYVSKVNVKPNNPSHVDNLSRDKTTEFGGYENNMEWVINDPKGYEQSKKGSNDKFANMFGVGK